MRRPPSEKAKPSTLRFTVQVLFAFLAGLLILSYIVHGH
jgi:hypothetical protein